VLEVDKRDMEHIFAAWHDLGSNIVKRYLQKLSVGLLQRLRYQRSAAANQQHGNGVFCGRRERLNSDDATHGSGIDMDMWLLWWSDLCAGAGRAACALCRSVAAAQTPPHLRGSADVRAPRVGARRPVASKTLRSASIVTAAHGLVARESPGRPRPRLARRGSGYNRVAGPGLMMVLFTGLPFQRVAPVALVALKRNLYPLLPLVTPPSSLVRLHCVAAPWLVSC